MVETLIYIHAALGGIALLSGGMALFLRKGSLWHKRGGRFFVFSMIAAATLAIFIAMMPGHQNGFLFSIGLFTNYFVISGFRSVRYKGAAGTQGVDKALAWCMVLIALGMMVYALVLNSQVNIVLFIFGAIGFLFGLRDLRLLRQPEKMQKQWMQLHLGKMTGGYIASVTAFVVVNQWLPGMIGWLAPSVLGTIYISYWMNRVNRKRTPLTKPSQHSGSI